MAAYPTHDSHKNSTASEGLQIQWHLSKLFIQRNFEDTTYWIATLFNIYANESQSFDIREMKIFFSLTRYRIPTGTPESFKFQWRPSREECEKLPCYYVNMRNIEILLKKWPKAKVLE